MIVKNTTFYTLREIVRQVEFTHTSYFMETAVSDTRSVFTWVSPITDGHLYFLCGLIKVVIERCYSR